MPVVDLSEQPGAKRWQCIGGESADDSTGCIKDRKVVCSGGREPVRQSNLELAVERGNPRRFLAVRIDRRDMPRNSKPAIPPAVTDSWGNLASSSLDRESRVVFAVESVPYRQGSDRANNGIDRPACEDADVASQSRHAARAKRCARKVASRSSPGPLDRIPQIQRSSPCGQQKERRSFPPVHERFERPAFCHATLDRASVPRYPTFHSSRRGTGRGRDGPATQYLARWEGSHVARESPQQKRALQTMGRPMCDHTSIRPQRLFGLSRHCKKVH